MTGLLCRFVVIWIVIAMGVSSNVLSSLESGYTVMLRGGVYGSRSGDPPTV